MTEPVKLISIRGNMGHLYLNGWTIGFLDIRDLHNYKKIRELNYEEMSLFLKNHVWSEVSTTYCESMYDNSRRYMCDCGQHIRVHTEKRVVRIYENKSYKENKLKCSYTANDRLIKDLIQ